MYGDFQSHVASQLEATGWPGLERFAKTRCCPSVQRWPPSRDAKESE